MGNLLFSRQNSISDGVLIKNTTNKSREKTFLTCTGELVITKYKWDSLWYTAKVWSKDIDGSYTVVFEDGTLQIGTQAEDISFQAANEMLQDQGHELYLDPSTVACLQNQMESVADNIWAAVRRGDLLAVQDFVDRQGVDPDLIEQIEGKAEGRRPLYWACLCGHVDIVKFLLSKGARDHDGSAYIAVTTNLAGDDNCDVYFDPDEGVYSDFVDYKQSDDADAGPDNSAFIRQLLRESNPSQNYTQRRTEPLLTQKGLPQIVYYQRSAPSSSLSDKSSHLCAICMEKRISAVCSPCGHTVGCLDCITYVRDMRQGCPVCRGRIRTIVPIKAKVDRQDEEGNVKDS
mmetsp:Transcript_18312/g.24160  ORF Transcript_18312/g.24160 Transcript_18312/m.24160 type:complete len:345 (-) Transcript_18312:460-1494(-)